MDRLTEEMSSCYLRIQDCEQRMLHAEQDPDDADAAVAEQCRQERRKYRELRQALSVLCRQLKDIEKDWIQAMRRLNEHHDSALVDCGLLDVDKETDEWGDADYAYDDPIPEDLLATSTASSDAFEIELRSEYDFPEAQIDDAPAESSIQARSPDDQANVVDADNPSYHEAMELRKPHREHERNVVQAHKAYDRYRKDYKPLLEQYIREQREERDDADADFATEIGPIYLQMGQEYAAEVQAAEKTLTAFEDRAMAAGISLKIERLPVTPEEFAAAVDLEDAVYFSLHDDAKVERWRNCEMDAVSLADTIPDELRTGRVSSSCIFRNATTDRQQDNDANSARAIIDLAPALSEPILSEKARVKRKASAPIDLGASKKRIKLGETDGDAALDDDDEESASAPTISRYNMRKRKVTTELPSHRPGERNPTPSTEASDRPTKDTPDLRLRVGEFVADSFSVVAGDPYFRRRIDAQATRLRDGWY
jgi:hypothetical protein